MKYRGTILTVYTLKKMLIHDIIQWLDSVSNSMDADEEIKLDWGTKDLDTVTLNDRMLMCLCN